MGIKDLMFKARASLQRRIQKKVKDYQAMQKRKKALEHKIREAQRKAYWEELERASIEEARKQARLKAQKRVQQGLTLQQKLARASQNLSSAKLFGYDPSSMKRQSPAEMILGKRKKEKE